MIKGNHLTPDSISDGYQQRIEIRAKGVFGFFAENGSFLFLSFIPVENKMRMLHRRKRNRLRGFDYTRNRMYFITSCVQDMACAFGEIIPVEDHPAGRRYQMKLNPCGQIVRQQWQWMAHQYPYVHLHAFIVMPNHVHGILEINRDLIRDINPVQDVDTREMPADAAVRTGRDLSVQLHSGIPASGMKIKSLSELIGAFKTTSSKRIHQYQAPDGSFPYLSFRWKRSFHDHIIRNRCAYLRICAYIRNNPAAWHRDAYYSEATQ